MIAAGRRHFLVVGAQRSGTTWLHDRLAAHPQVAMARPATPEPKVFLSAGPVDADDYRATYFGHAGPSDLLGEKSTSYIESATAPDLVAATLGEVPIVVQLRDPVARAVSNWSFSRDHGVEKRPLGEALVANLEGPTPWEVGSSSVSPFAYLERGRYVDDVSRWRARFPVHVQFLEEVLVEEERMAELFDFLGVGPADPPGPAEAPVNASSSVGEELDDDLVVRLRDYFADSDAALADLLGRDLPWTDRLQP